MSRASATNSLSGLSVESGRQTQPLLERLFQIRAPIGFGLMGLAVWLGWMGRDGLNLSAGEGLGYWLGVFGGTLMVLLLLYSVRKRIPFMRHLGPTRHWFRMHMTLGVLGPVIILYHSNFQVGSINSQVALFCTLLVAMSGVVGRYFYAQIHNGLYGSSSSLRQLIKNVEQSEQQSPNSPGLNADVTAQLAELADTVLRSPESVGNLTLSPIRLGLKTRWLNWQMRRAAYREIDAAAASSTAIKQNRRRLRRTTRRYISRRLAEIRRVAQFRFFKKLFSLWHIVHVPFFIMMVLSAIVHVLAVHMY